MFFVQLHTLNADLFIKSKFIVMSLYSLNYIIIVFSISCLSFLFIKKIIVAIPFWLIRKTIFKNVQLYFKTCIYTEIESVILYAGYITNVWHI